MASLQTTPARLMAICDAYIKHEEPEVDDFLDKIAYELEIERKWFGLAFRFSSRAQAKAHFKDNGFAENRSQYWKYKSMADNLQKVKQIRMMCAASLLPNQQVINIADYDVNILRNYLTEKCL